MYDEKCIPEPKNTARLHVSLGDNTGFALNLSTIIILTINMPSTERHAVMVGFIPSHDCITLIAT
jgi:hypothetical protein